MAMEASVMRASALFFATIAVLSPLHASRAAPLSKLIAHCDAVPENHKTCGNLASPVWRRFDGVTGAMTKVDVSSLRKARQGGVLLTAYTGVPGTLFDFRKLRSLYFTCAGQYRDMEPGSPLVDAPPLSVAGKIAAFACSRPERTERIIADWTAANDACQGGNVDWNAPICRKRDALQKKAQALGWCWAYSDWKVPRSEYQWHRCRDERL